MKKTLDIKKLILLNMPYILLGLFATNFGEAWRMAQGADASEKFLSLVAVLPGALQSFWPSLHPLDLLVGLCCGVGLRLAVYLKSKNAKKYRHGLEYGSARWGTREDMSVEFSAWKQEYTLLLKGQMTHRATLGTDPRGNLTRIDNALAQMPQRLEAAKAQLDNLYQQQAAAKEEVGKPFLYEEELKSKNARLVELDTLLNIDGKGPAHDEAVVAKSTRPSVLGHLKRPVPPRSTDKKPKQHEEVR